MIFFQLKQTKTISFHLLFWVAVWFFFIYFFSYNSNDTEYVSWFSSFLLPVSMLTSYFFVYYLIPKFLFTQKYFLFALYSFYTLVISAYLIVFTILISFVFLSNFDIADMPPMSKNYIFILILVYLVVAIISIANLLENNFKTLSRNKELENKILEIQLEKTAQELSYLKKQIHPHFLFNTLNTIYGFALKKSELTAELILKLSNLLDYILYQANKPNVSLKEEILHIKEYIELEKIRFQDTLKITFNAAEISEEIQVPPMLFIPFIENSFKHGSIIEGFLKLEIDFSLIEEKLIFTIKNTVLEEETTPNISGIGLENIKKRLTLYYQDHFDLKIVNQNNCFSVSLELRNILTIFQEVKL